MRSRTPLDTAKSPNTLVRRRRSRPAARVTLTALAVGALAAFAVPAQASADPAGSATQLGASDSTWSGGAVFALTDDPAGNMVVAYRRRSDGTLTQARSYRTGGLGAGLDGAVVDRSASQGALAVDRPMGRLLAVNPGSDSISVFAVGDGGSLRLEQVVPSGGRFPSSIAVSPDGRRVVVLDARDGGSIHGFRFAGGRLVPMPGWQRELGLTPAQGTPGEFTHTPGQVAFTPDGAHVVVTTKAASNGILVWNVGARGRLSATPVVHTDAGAVPFAVAFDAQGRMQVAEVGIGSIVSYRVRGDGSLDRLGATATGGNAVCWVSVHGDLVVSSNTGSSTLTSLRAGSGAPVRLGDVATGPAPVDSAFSPGGRYLYVQTGADNGVESYRVAADGSLTRIDRDQLPGPTGSEGIVAW